MISGGEGSHPGRNGDHAEGDGPPKPEDGWTKAFQLTDERLSEMLTRTILALNPGNLALYLPLRVLRAGRHSVTYQADCKVDGQQHIIAVFDKQAIAADEETERHMREVLHFRTLNPSRASFFADQAFYFRVEPFRENWTFAQVIAGRRRPSEAQIRFLVFGTVLELQEMHRRGLVHLGLCPSAIGMDAHGFPFLRKFKFVHRMGAEADFEWVQERRSGWLYMAPELLEEDSPAPSCDFYSLGVILYALVVRRIPGTPSSLKELAAFLAQGQLKINKNQIPEGWSLECIDLINRLILQPKDLRLGTFGGAKEVLSHAFFHNYKAQFRSQRDLGSSPFMAAPTDDELLDASDEDAQDDEDPRDAAQTPQLIPFDVLTSFLGRLQLPDAHTVRQFDCFHNLFQR